MIVRTIRAEDPFNFFEDLDSVLVFRKYGSGSGLVAGENFSPVLL